MNRELRKQITRENIQYQLRQKILAGQRSLADYLNLKCRHISTKATLILLFIFIAVASVALIRLIINATT